jgi:hypothetical protein
MPIIRTRTLFVSPDDDCLDALLRTAQTASMSLHAYIYAFTLEALADLFISKKLAGMTVGIVCDLSQSTGHAEHGLLQRLVDAGVPLTITTSPTGAIMHVKALLVDAAPPEHGGLGPHHNDSVCLYGSWNFSGHVPLPIDGETIEHFSLRAGGAQSQWNTLFVDNDPGFIQYLWLKYLEAEEYGRTHIPQLVPRQT